MTLVLVSIQDETGLERFAGTGLPQYGRVHTDAGSWLLAGADPDGLNRLASAGLSYQVLDRITPEGSYYLVYPMPGQGPIAWSDYGRVLRDLGSTIVLRATAGDAERLAAAGAEIRALQLTPKPVLLPDPSTRVWESITPDPLIQAMIDQVESTKVYSYTGDLSGEWPVSVGGQPYTIFTRNTYSGEPITKATQFVGEHLQGLGLDIEYHTWNVSRPPNVIGEQAGSVNPEEIYLITAHLDDMPSSGNAPGADDNASGSVAVLTAADILTQFDWGCTLRFVFFTGEEQGLLGSQAYASRSFTAGEDIQGVLNLDMIAWNSGGTLPTIDLHAESTLPDTLILAQLFADVVDAYNLNLIAEIVPNGTGASDHASFWDYGYNALLGIEDFSDFNPYYHTINDNLGNLEDLAYYTEFVRAAIGTFAHATGCLLPEDQGVLTGTVTDASTALPLEGAQVHADDGGALLYETLTDGAGVYSQTLPLGVYTVTATADGYLTQTVSGVSVVTESVTTLDFALEMPPCEPITGTNFIWEPGSPLVGYPAVFTATATTQSDLVYSWDFGDALVGVGAIITHTFITPGSFTVELTASSLCTAEVVTHTLQVIPAWALYLPLAPGGDPYAP
jgi:hypothetical protein